MYILKRLNKDEKKAYDLPQQIESIPYILWALKSFRHSKEDKLRCLDIKCQSLQSPYVNNKRIHWNHLLPILCGFTCLSRGQIRITEMIKCRHSTIDVWSFQLSSNRCIQLSPSYYSHFLAKERSKKWFCFV